MSDFTTFLDRCLDGLPRDKYRKRAKAELEDHLLTLCEELEAAGASPEEAQSKAVELMGAPDQLKASFRAEWVRRASNWKYCLGVFLKASLHAVLFNLLSRFVLIIPLLNVTGHDIFDHLTDGSLTAGFLFACFNFLPGLWFSARELHERFAIHPRRKLLLLMGLLVVWGLETFPLNISSMPHPHGSAALVYDLIIFFLYPLLLTQLPMVFMAWETPYSVAHAYRSYFLAALLLCVLFALFYHPKSRKPFLLSDKS